MPHRDTSLAIYIDSKWLGQSNDLNATQGHKHSYTATRYISIPNYGEQSGALISTQGHKPSYTICYYEKNSVSKSLAILSGISKHGCTHNIFTL